MTKYPIEKVAAHIRQNHPGCPDFAINYFAAEIAGKNWNGASIGKAVGITMQNYLRHFLTDYDTLLLQGMDRKAARDRVQPRISAMLRSWSKTKSASTTTHDSSRHENGDRDDG